MISSQLNQQATNPTNIIPSDHTELSNDSVDQSPVVTIQQQIQTMLKRQLESTLDSEEHATTKITEDQRNTARKKCSELHRYNFWDVDKLQTDEWIGVTNQWP